MGSSKTILGLFIAVLAVGVLGCGSGKTISRIDPGEQTDLSGEWNDTDSRLVSEEMISDCLGRPWLGAFMRDNGKNPTIIVGAMRNKTQEHIAVGTFVKDIERAFINSGNVQVVASAEEREGVRSERQDQRINASPETLKEFGREVGADFMLIGEINQIIDREGGKQVSFYQTDLSLIDIETNIKTWVGQKKIKKFIGRSSYKP